MNEDPSLESLSFEQAFEKLQTAVQALEEGGLSLEESIRQFELGIRLANLCGSLLDQAEMRVSQLLSDGEELPWAANEP